MNNCKMYLYLLLIYILIIYFFSPLSYSHQYILQIFIIYVLATYFYLKGKKITNYFEYEPIFICIYPLLVYIYPLLVFDEDNPYLFSFFLPYNTDCINAGVCVSTIVIISFYIGNLYLPVFKREINMHNYRKIPNSLFLICSFVLYIVYYLAGGFENYKNIYMGYGGESAIHSYLLVIIQTVFPIMNFNEMWNKKQNKNYHYCWAVFLLSIIVMLHFLFSGSRGNAMLIALSIIISYCVLIKRQPLIKLLGFIAVGVVVMWIFQSLRAGSEINTDREYYYLLSDLFIPGTNTFLAVDIVNSEGCTYGVSSLAPILSVIPFLQSIVASWGLTSEQTNSAEIFTNYIGSSSGMGTNFTADIYLAFGLLGTLIIPYFFGRWIAVLRSRVGLSYYSALLYIIISGFSVYMVRSSAFFLLKFIVFSLIISSFLIYLSLLFRKLLCNKIY